MRIKLVKLTFVVRSIKLRIFRFSIPFVHLLVERQYIGYKVMHAFRKNFQFLYCSLYFYNLKSIRSEKCASKISLHKYFHIIPI